MADCSSTMDRNTPRLMRWRVILEKKFSTALSHDAEVGGEVERALRIIGAADLLRAGHGAANQIL
jgi:hypothetical protein